MVCEHTLKAVRGSILDVTRTVTDPQQVESALRFIEDGLLLIRNGKVDWCGSWEEGGGAFPHRFGCGTTAAS